MGTFCSCSCPVGFFRAGCGSNNAGRCDQCTNGFDDAGIHYTSDGGTSGQCEFVACLANNLCLPGQELVNCSKYSAGTCIGDVVTTAMMLSTVAPTTLPNTTAAVTVPNTTAAKCPETCGDPESPVTCEQLMQQHDLSCAQATVYQNRSCDCSTCDACMYTTAPPTTSAAEVTTVAACPQSCQWNGKGRFQNCDYFLELTGWTCGKIEEVHDCDCSGCSLCESEPTTQRPTTPMVTTAVLTTMSATAPFDHGDCPVICGDPENPTSCNEVAFKQNMACPEIEEQYACDCNGCTACIGPTTTTTTTTTTSTTTTPELTTSTTCPRSCGLDEQQTCEDMVQDRGWSCSVAETNGCDCSGCECPADATTNDLPRCYAICDPDVDYAAPFILGPCEDETSRACCASGGQFEDDDLGLSACPCTASENPCFDGNSCLNCGQFQTTTPEVCGFCGPPGPTGARNCDDYLREQPELECADVEALYDDCSCFGCACVTAVDTTSAAAVVSTTTTTMRCPAECGPDGLTCDELIQIDEALFGNSSTVTCASVEEEYGCSCYGCLCDFECEATCGTNEHNLETCDQILTGNQFETCEEIELYFSASGERRVRRRGRELQEPQQPAAATTAVPISTNEQCHTSFTGVVNCADFPPPGVCCTLPAGESIETRCIPAQQCQNQGGSYVGQTTSLAVTGSPAVTSIAVVVLSNTECETTFMGVMNCLSQEPRGVCCATTMFDLQTNVMCSEELQCEMQGGTYPADDAVDTTLAVQVVTNGGGSVVTLTPAVVQTNEVCHTDFMGVMNCLQDAPPGVCCTMEQGPDRVLQTSCTDRERCRIENGVFPSDGTTISSVVLTGPSIGVSSVARSTNRACITDFATQDCLQSQPSEVCCTMQQGLVTSTRCMPATDCEMQMGEYDPIEETTTPSNGCLLYTSPSPRDRG